MKAVHNINKWSFTITLILYLGIYLGLFVQAFLGLIQIILAISLLLKFSNLDRKSQIHFTIYWILVITYFLIYAMPFEFPYPYSIIAMTAVPMTIAGYFVAITYHLTTLESEYNNADNLKKIT